MVYHIRQMRPLFPILDQGADVMNIEPNREYEVLDYTARLGRHTDSSAMFELGRMEDSLEVNGRKLKLPVFRVLGWLDLHYPCYGSHPLVIRSHCREVDDEFVAMQGIVSAVKQWLNLEESVPYEVTLIVGDRHHSIQHPFDGIPSYTNRDRFDVPEGFWDEWDARWRDRKDTGE